MSQRAVVREFGSEVEASIAVAVLRAHGIDADTKAIGFSIGFSTTMAGPTAVVVSADDIARARMVLDKPRGS